jgi:sporulation protein YhbH
LPISGDTIVKVPIRGIKEYRFVYGDNTGQVGQGTGDSKPGQVVGKGQDGEGKPNQGGDEPGVDYYETDISIDELVDLMFEDLELPDMERKALKQTIAQRTTRRKGYRRAGIRAHLDKKRTMKSRIRRKVATLPGGGSGDSHMAVATSDLAGDRFRFHKGDMRYRRRKPDIAYESNAVVICIMDTSGSMDTTKKYLARSFFFLLYQFVRTRYDQIDLVFVAHDARANEVSEDDFFHKGESGGTLISSGYAKALEIISERYHPSLWNIYAFHCSDGDNFEYDNPKAIKLAKELCDCCNLFGYGEIKPDTGLFGQSSMLKKFEEIKSDNYQAVSIKGKEDVWPSFKAFLSKERNAENA